MAERLYVPSIPAMGPIRSPVQWVLGLFPACKRLGVALTTHPPPHLARRKLKKEQSYTSPPSLCLNGRLKEELYKPGKYLPGDRGNTVVKALCYKLEGRWFDPR